MELQGSNVSAFGDDFTMATALEDLEFGFRVVTSTQKVRVKVQRSSCGHHCDIIVQRYIFDMLLSIIQMLYGYIRVSLSLKLHPNLYDNPYDIIVTS